MQYVHSILNITCVFFQKRSRSCALKSRLRLWNGHYGFLKDDGHWRIPSILKTILWWPLLWLFISSFNIEEQKFIVDPQKVIHCFNINLILNTSMSMINFKFIIRFRHPNPILNTFHFCLSQISSILLFLLVLLLLYCFVKLVSLLKTNRSTFQWRKRNTPLKTSHLLFVKITSFCFGTYVLDYLMTCIWSIQK